MRASAEVVIFSMLHPSGYRSLKSTAHNLLRCMPLIAQVVVRPVAVTPVRPLSLPNPAMELPPVSLPSLPDSGLAPLPVMRSAALQPPPPQPIPVASAHMSSLAQPTTAAGAAQAHTQQPHFPGNFAALQPPPMQAPPSVQKPPLPQMQAPAHPQQQLLAGVPGGSPSGVPLQRQAQGGSPGGGLMQPGGFPDPAVIKPLQPIAPLTLLPQFTQPRPVMQSGSQIQASGDALQGHTQPPSLQALQEQQQQQQQGMLVAASVSSFREPRGAAAGGASPAPAKLPPSAFAASAGLPAGSSLSGRMQVPPRLLILSVGLFL